MEEKVNNTLMISIDTLRADHLSCYGYPRITSPHLDLLAKESFLFENCISNCTHTMPAYTSMFTGLSAMQHGITGTLWCLPNEDSMTLDDNIPTLAELLQTNGYLPAAVDNLNSMACHPKWFPRGFKYYINLTRYSKEPDIEEKEKRSFLQRVGVCSVKAEEINYETLRWLKEHRKEEFFLFLHYWDTHQPYNQPEPFRSRFKKDPLASKTIKGKGKYFLGGGLEQNVIRSKAKKMIDLYDGEISYVDKYIGEIIASLQELGLYEDTWILVTADHGETMAEHNGYFTHREPYDAVLRVPFLIKPPKSTSLYKRIRRIDSIVQQADIFPTIVDILRLNYNGTQLEGSSLLSLMEGKVRKIHSIVYSTGSWIHDNGKWKSCEISARTHQWKYIRRADISKIMKRGIPEPFGFIGLVDFYHPEKFNALPRNELYKISDDKEELFNLIKDEPKIAEKLELSLCKWVNQKYFVSN